ncbi:MAG: molybdopterin-dependent oxidoreductase [Planctomycetes bacterium]|jgi:isoquinoline 1-oxidoreductase|nr:molybdopterin-dependent oxidoreductase [Planctomycetota bacterium]
MNDNELLNLDFTDIRFDPMLSRRDLLKALGGGIFIFFCVGEPSTLEAQGRGRSYPEDFNAYLRIGPDGRVTCYSGKIEQGQGVITSLAQMLADEIDVSLESVDMVMGDTSVCPWDMGTFGSMSTRFFGPPLRAAGAEARRVLLELAAEQLKVPQDQLVAENGVIYDKQRQDKRVTYGALAQGKTMARRAGEKPVLKNPSQFKVMNKSFLRRDSVEKVTGKALYAGDIRLPGMLYAKILRPPAHGAKLKKVDTSAAEKIEGVTVVRDGDLIAVLHKNPDQATEALAKVSAEFESSPLKVDDQTIFDHLLQQAGKGGNPTAQGGNLQEGEKLAEVVVEQTYLDGYKAHAAMETHTALAHVEGNKATVWISTQTPFPTKDQIVKVLGFGPDDVRVITPFVGGGFGGKSSGQQAIEAARLAKAAGKPVQVAWSREEEFFYDTFRPAAVVKIKSGMTKAGKAVLWDYAVYYAGSRGAPQFYDIPHHRTLAIGGGFGGESAHPFATGAWRAPGNNTNCFARESQIDIMAAQAKMDPIEFRLKNLKDPRAIRVLKAAAEKFGWKPAPAPSGRGLGVAVGTDSDTFVAEIAEVEVDKRTGRVQVQRVLCVQDMGLVINPQGATIQVEGCIQMGLGYTLTEDIHFKDGMILDRNFDTYELPRFSSLPKIETVLLDLKDEPAHGGGEPAIIIVGAVVANAIHDATGARLLQLPMTPERVRKAIAATA